MKFISTVFHPLLLTTYTMVVFFFFQPQFFSPVDQSQIPKLIVAAFITTFVIPILSVFIMKLTSRITSLSLSSREERFLPFLSILLFYGSTAYLFITRIGIKPPLSIMMIAMTLLITLLLIITSWQKISIHAAASWALVGLLVGTSIKYTGMTLMYPLLASVITAGLVSSSRLFLGRHSIREVGSGSLIGFLLSFISILIFG
jgi:membrane-associated phospholipid phosphatase